MRVRTLSVPAAVAMWLAMGGPALAQVTPGNNGQPAPGTWAIVRTSATNRPSFANGGAASDGTYLYLFGGLSSDVRRFSPVTYTWDVMTPMPALRTHPAAACVGGFLYAFGGSDGSASTASIYRYDLSAGLLGSWTLLPVSLTPAREGAAAAVLGGRIYITGGFDTGSGLFLSETLEFDPSTETLAPGADMPSETAYHATVGFDLTGRLYSYGGLNSAGVVSAIRSYDPSQDVWRPQLPCPAAAAYGVSAFTAANRVYFTGGAQADGSAITATREYQPLSDSWNIRRVMRGARTGHGTSAIGTRAQAYGGIGLETGYEEYAYPQFRQPPLPAANVLQETGGQPVPLGGFAGGQVVFSADVSDPDSNDALTLIVQVKPAADLDWINAIRLTSASIPNGRATVAFDPPDTGAFDWRYVVVDREGNTPGGTSTWVEFDAGSPDFYSDLLPPGSITPVRPVQESLGFPDQAGGIVTFEWTAAADNYPGNTYELEIYIGAGPRFFHQAGIPSTTHSMFIPRSRETYHWRVRSTDRAGLAGPWTAYSSFQVGYKDPKSNAAGDAERVCGFSSAAAPGGGSALVLALLALAAVQRARFTL